MKQKKFTLACAALALISSSSVPSFAQEEEDCFIDESWVTGKVAPDNRQPESPLEDCSAYRWAWQTFLYITSKESPSANYDFLLFPGFDDVFKIIKQSNFARISDVSAKRSAFLNLAPRTPEPETPSVFDGIKQAGLDGILVDQNGQAIFYAIHMNSVFVDFVKRKGINNFTKLESIDPDVEFPIGSLELKSSWMVVDSINPPKDYLITKALIPSIKKAVDGSVFADPTDPVEATVAMLGLHVVGVIENHPEFIWASFEHDGLAPPSLTVPPDPNADYVVNADNYILYSGGTSSKNSNLPVKVTFDEITGKLSPSTSVFRYFATAHLSNLEEDKGVVSLNESAWKVLREKFPNDPRSKYKLIGAVWLKNGSRDFLLNKTFVDAPGTPDDKLLVAGENALSNMSMESFTQKVSPSCFNCHKTRAGESGLDAKKINVSHIPLMFHAREKSKIQ